MELGLGGKRVLITGSSRGIGLACAKAFLDEGAIVILNGRNAEHLHRIAEELRESNEDRVYSVVADVLTDNGAGSIQRFVKEKIQGLDIFIANLGNGKAERTDPLDTSEWKRFYDINVLGNLKMLNAIHDFLVHGENPNMVFVSSVIAKEASQAPAGYAAAKSAVLTLNKYLSRSWAEDGIRVNCVLPGNVYFEGGRWEELKRADEDGVSEYIRSVVPMKRFARPEEVADAILFLSSERASFITGAELSVDGGQMRTI